MRFAEFLEACFPLVQIRDLILRDQAQKIAAGRRSGVYPHPQCCQALHGLMYNEIPRQSSSDQTTTSEREAVATESSYADVPSNPKPQAVSSTSDSSGSQPKDAAEDLLWSTSGPKRASSNSDLLSLPGASSSSSSSNRQPSPRAISIPALEATRPPAAGSPAGGFTGFRPPTGRRVQGVVLIGDAAHCFPPDLGQVGGLTLSQC